MSIKIGKINKVELKLGRVLRETLKKAAEKVLKNSAAIEKKISSEVRKYTKKVFKTNEIVKSIGGNGTAGGFDLQAHFGLTDDAAASSKTKILEGIEESIYAKITKGPIKRTGETGNSSLGLEIVIFGTTTEELAEAIDIGSPPFTYVSVAKTKHPKHTNGRPRDRRTTIPWMKWVLDPLNTLIEKDIPSIKDFQIVFGTDFTASRSGKAIMKQNRRRGNSGFSFYQLPTVLFPKGKSKNFIEQVFNSAEYRKDVESVVTKTFGSLRSRLR